MYSIENYECQYYTNYRCIIHLYHHIKSSKFCINENGIFLEIPPNRINNFQYWILSLTYPMAIDKYTVMLQLIGASCSS